MAFAASNVKSCSLGGAVKLTTGDWTGAVGDAAGSFVVAGGKVYGLKFLTNLSTGPQEPVIKVSPAGTAGYVTLTINNTMTVTAGTFSIIHA